MFSDVHPKMLTTFHTSAVFEQDVAFFERELAAAADASQRAVLLTHHAPLLQHGVGSAQYWFSQNETAFGSDLKSRLIDKHDNLTAIVYGHTHHPQNSMFENGVRIVSNPLGYREFFQFNKFFLIHSILIFSYSSE